MIYLTRSATGQMVARKYNKMTGIPLASVERLMKRAGAERVSASAAKELKGILEEIAEEMSKKAAKFARHAGRKTIKPEDVKLAR